MRAIEGNLGHIPLMLKKTYEWKKEARLVAHFAERGQ
jgi:hypothetical protein